jgi:hypothetical protein
MISGKARAHRTSAQVVACSFKMVRVTGSGKFTKAVSKKLHVEDAEDKDEADSDKEEETVKEVVKDDEQENADGSDDEEEAGGSDDDEDDEDVELEDEDEDDGLGGSDNDEEEEEGAVKTGKSRKRNVFIDDAAEVSSRPEPTRVIPLAAVQFQRRVNIAAA